MDPLHELGIDALSAIAIGALLVIGLVFLFEKSGSNRARPRRFRRDTSYPPRPSSSPVHLVSSAVQAPKQSDHIKLVAEAEFQRVPLLNRSEARLLPSLDRIVRELGNGHRLLLQVAMGELLCATGENGGPSYELEANRAISAKRLDFAIVDRRGLMVAAIEYQGSGHHLSTNAFMRDAVKREALRKAGISLIELPPDADDALIRERLRTLANLPVAAAPDKRPAPPNPKALTP